MDVLHLVVLQNGWRSWLTAIGIAALVWLIMQGIRRHLGKRLRKLAQRTGRPAIELSAKLVDEMRGYVFLIVAIYLGIMALTLPAIVMLWAKTTMLIFIFIQLAIWGSLLIGFGVRRYAESRGDEGEVATVQGLSFVARLALYALLLILALDQIPGVEMNALLASLGIGGIAVALAVQNILGDLFASLSIALDQPFMVGDFISVDGLSGRVEHVGLKTTRVRSLSGEELIFSNSDLLQSRIRNYKSMEQRRVAFTVSVSCDTPPDLLREIPTILEEIIGAQEQVRFERAHFASFGDFSFDFAVVYHMLKADYGLYMDTQQAVNLGILERFAERGIEMPYPTQVVKLERPQA